MGRKSRRRASRAANALATSPAEPVSRWARFRKVLQDLALVLGVLTALVTNVSGIVVITLDYFRMEEPKVKFSAAYLRNPVRTQFGRLVPEEIAKHIPDELKPHVQTIELYAFKDCAYLSNWKLIVDAQPPPRP